MEKSFLTYEEQLTLLRQEKNISCETPQEHALLRRIGYFNLVHGYRMPFLTGFTLDGSGIYLNGTHLTHLAEVKRFDDDLRHLLFRSITAIEEEVRTFAAYAFSDENGGLDWIDPCAYGTTIENGDFRAMMHRATREIEHCDLPYVSGYIQRKQKIPTFIMTKVVYLFTFISFLDLCNSDVKTRLCHLYGLYNKHGYPDHKLLLASFHWIRRIRNVCAHNERLFTFDGTTRGGQSNRIKASYFKLLPVSYTRTISPLKIMDLLVYFKYYLNGPDYDALIGEISAMLTTLEARIPEVAFGRVRASMGIRDVHHLTALRSAPKVIDYHGF